VAEKITELTPEQEAALEPHRDMWLKIGLSTDRADRVEAEAGAREAYTIAGLDQPEAVIWLDSPMMGAIGAWMLASSLAEEAASGTVAIGDRDGGNGDCDERYPEVWERIMAVLAKGKDYPTFSEVWAGMTESARNGAKSAIREQVRSAAYGQHDAGWLSFNDYFRVVVPVEGTEKLSGLIRVAKSCGWWWPFDRAIILTERPTALHLDPQQRLHNADGPAIRYADGFALYSWHGTRVPAEMIRGEWDTTRILQEPNAEVRRSAIERLGWDEFVIEAELKQVGEVMDDPGNTGFTITLYDVPAAIYDEPVRVLICTNGTVERGGTRRRFGLTTPVTVNTPLEAAAWGYGITAEQYAQLQRRA